ncbi:MAG: YdaU family protein [Planctomycetes bacterium]|nr:YdaU family protein [Planctomycetota bacterium]
MQNMDTKEPQQTSTDATELPSPLTTCNCDLRDFPHTPIFRARLFGSSFHAKSSDSEWRAGVTLWLRSWDQVPAGSLPSDEVELCRLAELGRDLKAWRKVAKNALRGWNQSNDGRLYHATVAEGVNTAYQAKQAQRFKTLKARIAALQKHLRESKSQTESDRLESEIKRLSLTLEPCSTDSVTESVTDSVTESKEKRREGKEKGRDIKHSLSGSAGGSECARDGQGHGQRFEIPDSECERVWAEYPKQTGKIAAFELIRQACWRIADANDLENPVEAIELLIERVRAYAKACRGREKRFIAEPKTWFSDGKYLDPKEAA